MLSNQVKQKLSELLAKAWRSKKVDRRLKGKNVRKNKKLR